MAGRKMIPKFRAWDKKTERMWDIETWHIADEYVDLIEPGKSIADINAERFWRKQSEIILMQSTGLKDKNGVEIYEGDVLYFEPYKTHINDRVVQNIDGAYHGRLIRSGYSKLLAECVYETKVIGNIYENSDLLEIRLNPYEEALLIDIKFQLDMYGSGQGSAEDTLARVREIVSSPSLTDDQQVVLDYLKSMCPPKLGVSAMATVYCLIDDSIKGNWQEYSEEIPEHIEALQKLSVAEENQVFAAFAEWGMEQEEE